MARRLVAVCDVRGPGRRDRHDGWRGSRRADRSDAASPGRARPGRRRASGVGAGRRKGMRPRIGWGALAIIGASLASGLLLAGPAGASGGGGCGLPVTDAHGTRVHVKNFCFRPTVLHVRRGEAVTFTNRDAFAHTVSGANVVWGSFDSLTFGKPVMYRFMRPGVYPYFCAIHPGMVGAIVVGNGNGRGDAKRTTTERGPVIRVERFHAVRADLAPIPLPDGAGGLPWPVSTLVGIGLLAVAGLALLQLRQQMR